MNIFRTIISLVIFGVALFVGFKAGTQIDLLESLIELSLDRASVPDIPIPNNEQFNVLIIGMDENDPTSPQLESIWLAAYGEVTHKLTFMPIFPSPTSPQQNQLLSKAFYLEQGKPSKTFWNALKTTHLWWEGYILTNRSATIEIVDMLNGIYVNETLMDGNQTVNEISSWENDPQLAMDKQKDLLEGICHRLAQNTTLSNKSTWELLFNKPSASNFRTILQVANWSSKFRENGTFTCEFPVSNSERTTRIGQ